MIDLLYAEVNVTGIALLLLFLNNMFKRRQGRKAVDQRLFNLCLILNILIFFFDTIMWVIDGYIFPLSRTINVVATTFYYVLNPFICLVWLLYTDYKIYENKNGLLKRLPYYLIPCVISAIFSIISPFTNWLFIIDANNVYVRGSLFWIMAVISLLYLASSFVMSIRNVIINGWENNKTVNIHLLLFPICLVAASVLQIWFYGLSIIWISATIALASIYINIQNVELSTDYLTGLNNRRRLDEHFNRIIKMHKKENLLFAVLIDLDDFKVINDEHGHAVGDKALIEMAELLRKVCKVGDDFIARLGGDEFLILGERTKTEEIIKLMDDISSAAKEYNEAHKDIYLLRPSLGYSVYKKDDNASSLLVAADQAMYRNKQERKLTRNK